MSGSSCVNLGSAEGAPALDIDADLRDAFPDIGADEYMDTKRGHVLIGKSRRSSPQGETNRFFER
jgi:hypothetical protein